MSREDEQWRMGALRRFGEQFDELERAEQRRRASWSGILRRVSPRWATAGVIASALAVVVAFETVTPAGANSPVNRAPRTAEHSKSVRFSSSQTITLNGHPVLRVRETGALDFTSGAFTSRTTIGETTEPIERRRMGGVLYFRRRSAERAWSAVRVGASSSGSYASSGGYSLIDPQVVLRVMAGARSPVSALGPEEIGGVRCERYQVATSLTAFLAAENGLTARAQGTASPVATMNVWLDGHGRPLRVETAFIGDSRRGVANMTAVVNFSNYGAAVHIARPRLAKGPSGLRRSPVALGDPLHAIERVLFPAGKP